jgi:diguanylate cyclase (GGDEF)-like protein/PAS domain S-box-containing protein
MNLDPAFLRLVVDGAPEGIVICDATGQDCPVIYVNDAFQVMTGYGAAELLGSNLRILQGADRDQEARRRLREAIARGEACRVLLRNYRKSGDMIWNELYLQPLRSANGALTHWAGFIRDASGRLRSVERAPEGLPVWLREDRVSGLSSKAWFDELLAREWKIARREAQLLTLVLLDMDALGSYNDTFGRAAGDACIRRIARVVSGAFRRGSDIVARWDEGGIAVLAVHRNGTPAAGVVEHVAMTTRRIAEMHVHHPHSPVQKFVTVTAGLATVTPAREEESPQRLIDAATAALRAGKEGDRGGVSVSPPGK